MVATATATRVVLASLAWQDIDLSPGAILDILLRGTAADALFGQLTALISSTVLALVVLSLAVAFGAWIAGPSRAALAIRGAADAGFSAVRRTADRHGLDTRGFGRLVGRWHSAIVVVAIALGVLVLFLNRPATLGGVIGTIATVLVVLLVVELVRRPGGAGGGEGGPPGPGGPGDEVAEEVEPVDPMPGPDPDPAPAGAS